MNQPTSFLPAPELRNYIASYGILEIPAVVNEPYFSPPIGLSGFIIQTINTSEIVIAKIQEENYFTENAVATGQVTYPVYGQMMGQMKSLLVFFPSFGNVSIVWDGYVHLDE
jgi:hypothetical protein